MEIDFLYWQYGGFAPAADGEREGAQVYVTEAPGLTGAGWQPRGKDLANSWMGIKKNAGIPVKLVAATCVLPVGLVWGVMTFRGYRPLEAVFHNTAYAATNSSSLILPAGLRA